MNKGFYFKLAWTNLKNNARTYIPYLLTCISTVMMFYILKSLSLNDGLYLMAGGDDLAFILNLGTYVIAVFALIFLFYTNSFLMKRRQKEFALFNILGMEKQHVSRIIDCETLLSAMMSLAAGLVLGIALDKVMFLLLAAMFEAEVPLGFHVDVRAITATLVLFIGIFILMDVHTRTRIHLVSPIELLHSSQSGEKEPKAKWFMSLLGLICLGIGYYISVTTTNPLAAFGLFFVAVLLVIAGTYLLFTAGSITLLKALKKNQHYYYQTNHFISISGMIYRMKQNAVGLANICILSTMVLVVLSSTMSLWMGIEDVVHSRFPREMTIRDVLTGEQQISIVESAIDETLGQYQLEKKNVLKYTYLGFAGLRQGDYFDTDRSKAGNLGSLNDISNMFFITLSDYNLNQKVPVQLNDSEILIYGNKKAYGQKELKVFDELFTVKEELDHFDGDTFMAANTAASYFVVVKDETVISRLNQKQKEVYGAMASDIQYYTAFDLSGDSDNIRPFYEALSAKLDDQCEEVYVECQMLLQEIFISLYGGLLFIGIFLSILFMIATILIIYYKQITEGYEDRSRYEMMLKVGMDQKDIRKSINSQILTVFFLPLLMAVIHIAFAFPIINQLLNVLYLDNTLLFMTCTAGCIGVFGLGYILVYFLTAKTYYAVVQKKG